MNAGALTGKRILLTGAAGHIGSHIARALIEAGASVLAAVRPGGDRTRLADMHDQVEQVALDLASIDLDAVATQLDPVQIVIHLGAAGVNPSDADPARLMAINEGGTRALIELARRWNVERFVYTGSCIEYPEGSLLREDTPPAPRSPYAVTKFNATTLVRASIERDALPAVILRPFTVYGGDESPHRLVSTTIRACLNHQSFALTGGAQRRDFIHIADVTRAVLIAATDPRALGGVFNVCTGVETSIRALVEQIVVLTNSHATPQFGALPYRPNEFFQQSGDPSLARARLGFSAEITLRDGLTRAIAWYKEQH